MSGAAGGGLLASQGPPCGAPLPPRATCACSRLDQHAGSMRLGWRSPAVGRSKVRPMTSVARGADAPVCLGRPGGPLAGRRWLGQGLHQRPDLGIGVASMPAQGTEVWQPAVLCPATHRLGGHMKELGDLRCTEVPRLGWRWHHALLRPGCPPCGGRPYAHRERTPSSVLHTQWASRRMTACDGWTTTPGRLTMASSLARGAPPSRSGCA